MFKDIVNKISSLPEYEIEIGVITSHKDRTTKSAVRVGVTNAELMYIHEKGSPLHNIPARPVLDMTLKHANTMLLEPTIDKALDAFIKAGFDANEFEIVLKRLCIEMENYARDIIYLNDGRLEPNSPSVAARKKGNHPLFDTGQLARSITCQLIKVGE